MGDLRFSVPQTQGFDPRIWETAYITGIEGIPWYCHHALDGDQFSIGREIDESGKLNILWPTQNFGNVCLSTTSLKTSARPYVLVVELARGTVCRLRNQTAEWQRVGLRLPDKFFPLAEDALSQLLRALTSADNSSQQQTHAQKSIDMAVDAAMLLCNTFAAQSLEARRQNEGRLSTLMGVTLPADCKLSHYQEALAKSFNLFCISASLGAVENSSSKPDYTAFDQQVDWAIQADKKVCLGPLVNFRKGGLPEWMVLLDEGFESILKMACEYTRATVERFRGKAHIWNCAAGLNIPNDLNWSDEEVLRMAVSLIETVRRADDRCPVLLTIDQPWSEYLCRDRSGISPLHFADALIRADLGLSGLALDLRMDAYPNGTFPRDPIEVNRLIDRWSMLGLPLMIILSGPTEQTGAQVSNWKTNEASNGIVPAESLLRLLLSKPSVHALVWNEMQSAGKHARGLWNNDGSAQPILSNIAALRKVLLH